MACDLFECVYVRMNGALDLNRTHSEGESDTDKE